MKTFDPMYNFFAFQKKFSLLSIVTPSNLNFSATLTEIPAVTSITLGALINIVKLGYTN